MQDPNGMIFDSDLLRTPEELTAKMTDLFEDKGRETPSSADIFKDMAIGKTEDSTAVPKVNMVKKDIEDQKAHSKNKIKANIFDTLFSAELQRYYDEHKHIMPSNEKRRLKSILIKKIDKGDIYINKVGKLIIRKGKNK